MGSRRPAIQPTTSRDVVILRAALRASVRGSAAEDVLRRAGQTFPDRVPTLEEADGWLGQLRGEAGHLFVPSTGAGAGGSEAFPANNSLDRTPYLGPEEAGANAERIAKGLPVW